MNHKLQKSTKQTKKTIGKSLPIVLGILMLVSLFNTLIKIEYIKTLFHENILIDSLIGTIFGSIAIGTPITSYIIGGELIKSGISMVAVTAFIVSWISVGIIDLPAEMMMLGKKFGIIRNILNFISAIMIALITWFILSYI